MLPGIDAQQTLQRVAPALLQTVKVFEQQGFQPFQALFNERDALKGVSVTLSDGTSGVALGVDAGGALQVQTEQGLKAISSAEVSVRPLQTNPQTAP